MYISFDGVEETLKTLLKLFVIGLVVSILFHIAIGLLPLILLGFGVVYAINHFGKKDKTKDVTVRK